MVDFAQFVVFEDYKLWLINCKFSKFTLHLFVFNFLVEFITLRYQEKINIIIKLYYLYNIKFTPNLLSSFKSINL